MDLDPVLLSRIQFAFVVSFHIIFPAFTIGLAAWLAVLEGAHLATGRTIYRRVFEFWIKVFAVSFGMGVVTGIVMAFQFGTNWGVLAEKMGGVQGPLLGYEAFTAFLLEATFFGVMLLGRDRVSPRSYLFACCMVALGTMFSSFWIWDSREVGLTDFAKDDRPPVLIPFFGFRIMVDMGLLMLAIGWFGLWLRRRGRLEHQRWFLWCAFLSFPSGFIAVLAGWFTAEVGRQPWVVYGLLRTADAVTPSLRGIDVLVSLAGYVLVYAVLVGFGLRSAGTTPKRPMALAATRE